MQSRWRIAAFKMIMSYQFEMLIIVAIILNLLIMALTHADMNSHWQNFMSYANLAFTVAFTAEAGAKCVVLGVRAYLRVSILARTFTVQGSRRAVHNRCVARPHHSAMPDCNSQACCMVMVQLGYHQQMHHH
eukprot:GHRR01033337.1.p1 GENE.GHRR01033337.1~~GHRR01033337.1.p1  ORF type:complete len:132 (+),score=25.30 GHRR01033337.1:323-718(+)